MKFERQEVFMSVFFGPHPVPSESYSRELDERVAALEMPYGYTIAPPAADTGDYDSKARETKKVEKSRKR